MLSEKAKQELRTLYDEIDECITNIVHSRIHHDEKAEGLAMFKMESLMVGTLQTISWLIEHEKHYDKERLA